MSPAFLKRAILILVPAVIVLIVWLILPYLDSPEKQLEKRHQDLISAASRRSWKEVEEMIAADYKDEWEQKREDSVTTARQLLSGFLVLDMTWKQESLSIIGNTAQAKGLVTIDGKGMGGSEFIMDRVNRVKAPWVFTWRKDGTKRTDWKLISVSNEELAGMKIPKDW
ncbi:hypothetical protein BH11VER1_BH11VER1_29420 [soil metagenome]